MAQGTQRVRKQDYRPPTWRVDTVELAFDLDAAATRVVCHLRLHRDAATDAAAPLRLDGEGLDLRAIHLDGVPLGAGAYDHNARGLTIHEAPDACELRTEVVIHPAANTALLGLYQAGELLCTQCEPEAFRRITFFPDRPDILARYRVTLTADARRYPVLLANGDPSGHETLADGRHRAVWVDPHPKPSYLFALVAGDLTRVADQYTTGDGRSVALTFHVTPRNAGRCGHALDALKRAMAWDEARYGRLYDLATLNLLAVSEYTMGAMENKGLLVFNDRRVLTDPDTGTDRDHRDIEALAAHEYFHNWTGNRITCRDWFQLALKEGFTVFREQQFVADQGWDALRRIEDTRLMRTRQFAEDAGPLAHPVRPEAYDDIEVFYTDTVYSKGAEIIRMLATWVGGTAFRAGTDRFFERHDGEAVTVEDFLACLGEAAGEHLDGFLEWYDHAGTPALSITASHDPATATYTLVVRQAPPGGRPLPVPLALGLLDDAGRSLPLHLDTDDSPGTATTRVVRVTAIETRLCFRDVPTPPTPALLRGFSAPVTVGFDYTNEQLVRLACHDPDPVTRWDAVQQLTGRAVDNAMVSLAVGRPPAPDTRALAGVFAHVLEHAAADPGLAAELLTLPDTTALLAGRPGVEVDDLHRTLTDLRQQLATGLEATLTRTHDACRTSPGSGYKATPAECGRRALANVCLGHLVAAGGTGAQQRCLDQYQDAGSLTEVLAALQLLVDSDAPDAAAALADFHRQRCHEPMMVDKWLAVQARPARPDTVARVRALTAEVAYDRAQPSRVRSLVGVFAAENPVAFHRTDGAGYELLADEVLALDPLNPSLAAELLRHLGEWRGHTPGRARAMRAALDRVAATPDLSTGTREVATACLGPGAPG